MKGVGLAIHDNFKASQIMQAENAIQHCK